MPIYKCDSCNYVSRDKSNFSKHLLSVKHIEKEHQPVVASNQHSGKIIYEVNHKKFKCGFCGNLYSTAGNLAKHKRICNDKQILEDNYQKIVNELKNELIHLKQLHKKELKHQQDQIESLKEENQWLKSTVTGAGSIIKSSMSTANYIITNFKDAPALMPVEDYSKLTYANHGLTEMNDDDNNDGNDDDNNDGNDDNNNDDIDNELNDKNKFVECLIFQYHHKTLAKYLGDIIVKHYKKKDPEQQSIWNSDSNRLTYIIRELFNDNKIDWLVDKKGIKTTNYIINPFLDHIDELVCDYMNLKTKFDRQTTSVKELELNFPNLSICAEIRKDISGNFLSEEILKYIAPYFHYMKSDNKLLES